ncbi:hotdog domain-containing protein [Fictibacillus sp. B-59209]|uniref:acyl-CoA thioesterase n=1 Tax=Fictibacillus sp. B-59209 TaxID=3024873 RepID=UPI002E248FA0|nr:hotdog domain-containing protein [Fictibacillus sp. B-59209]
METYHNRFDFVLRKTSLEFIHPAYLDELLLVGCSVVKLGKSSFNSSFSILREGENDAPLLEAQTTYINIDQNGKPRSIPEDVRSRIIQFEKNLDLGAKVSSSNPFSKGCDMR